MKRLHKLLRLTSRERSKLAQALIMLPMTALMLRLIRLRRFQRILSVLVPRRSILKSRRTEAPLIEARRISQIVGIAVVYGIYTANCLQRSLVLWLLLRREGIEGSLHFGTRIDGGQFRAHAWIEVDGVVLNDDLEVRERYAPFDRAIVPGTARL